MESKKKERANYSLDFKPLIPQHFDLTLFISS